MKPEAALLMVLLAAALGACGDRGEEAGAPASGASNTVPAAPPAVIGDPAKPPPASTPETALEAPPGTSTPAAVVQGPEASRPMPGPVAASPSATAPSATAPAQSQSTPASPTATGTVLRADKLYSEPAATSNVMANVAKGASVEILAKQGGWLRVTTGGQSGWIRLLSVRAGAGGLGGAGVGDVIGAATTRSDPSRIVAVAGLRGLNDEDLKQAQFNAEELARMEARNASPTQIADFANQSGLAKLSVPDLPKPQSRQSSTWESN